MRRLGTHGANTVGPDALTASVRRGRYCFENFTQAPWAKTLAAGLTTVNASELVLNLIFTGRHNFEYNLLADNTDGVNEPVLGSEGGYDWTTTGTDLADGFEINFGGSVLAHPRNFTPSSENWFARILLSFDNASGADILFGFRKVATPVKTLTEITDVIGIRLLGDSSSTRAAITLLANLNNGGTSDYVSTTPNPVSAFTELLLEDTDVSPVELEVRCVARVAHLYINGVELAGYTYTFDSGDRMCVILQARQTTDLFTQLKTLCYEAGPLEDRQSGTLLDLSTVTT